MSGRLDTVKSLVVAADTVADVGCDHGKLAEYCVRSGLARRVIASDISESCLEKARKRLANARNVTFLRCDGIDYECDEAIVAGMGGILVADILRKARCKPKTLVLCPHRDGKTVRETLLELGYSIDRDVAVRDRGRFYSVMRADLGGEPEKLDGLQLLFGKYCDAPDAVLREWLTALYKTYAVAREQNAAKLGDVTAALKLQGVSARDVEELIKNKNTRFSIE